MKLLKSIIGVAASNIASFGTSFIIGFILPVILSVSDYGYYREYVLYLSFAYLFNVGFNDGIYIKYGGKDIDSLNKKTITEEHNFILVFQMIVLVLMLGYSIIQSNLLLALFSLSTFFVSMNTYHQNFLQAVGEFRVYSRGNILKSIFYIIILLIGTLVIQADNYPFYVILNVLSLIFLFLYYEWNRIKQYGFSTAWSTESKYTLFKTGIFILIANMSLTFIANIGSWIVNFGFPIEDFAQYSFQNSVLNVMLLIINAVGMVFYNVISRHENQVLLNVIKEISLLLGVFAGVAFFIFSLIIETFIPDYVVAIDILAMTFLAIPYIMISKILIANIYKSRRHESKYFKDSLLFAGFSFVFVGLIYLVTNSLTIIALATTICYVLWYVYTTRFEFNYMKGGKKESQLLLSHFVIFYISSSVLNNTIGFFVYLVYLLLISYLYKNRILEIINNYLKT